jgi:hypothetical protein
VSVGVTAVAYTWVDGFTSPIDPNVAGKEFARIAKRDQELVPFALVEESRDPSSPLHAVFEWNDREAATRYREGQAEQLIQSIQVVYVRNDTEDELPPMRAYVNVINDAPEFAMYEPVVPDLNSTKGYVNVRLLHADDFHVHHVQSALKSLLAWRKRYHDVESLRPIFEVVDMIAAND